MKNPWLQLQKKAPFVLSCDAKLIDEFNRDWSNTQFEIILSETPSPYIGDPEAQIVFLNLNPGYSPYEINESSSLKISHCDEIARENLLHKFYDYPFYVLDPSLAGTPSGYEWFNQRFSPLIKAAGMNTKELSKKIFLAEFFPYRSKKFKWVGSILPSQEYVVSLVEKAISRQAIIVIMRGEKLWFSAIPTLEKYYNRYTLHSPQNVTISEKNLGKEGFKVVIENLLK